MSDDEPDLTPQEQRAIRSLRTTQTKFQHGITARRETNARSFGRDQRLKIYNIQ